MKRQRACIIGFTLAFGAITTACGVEAADGDSPQRVFAVGTSSGNERAPRHIVRIQTRDAIVNVDSTGDGVRYGLAGGDAQSLDRLRIDHPEIYEILTRSTATPAQGIDARVDRSVLDRHAHDSPLIGDVDWNP